MLGSILQPRCTFESFIVTRSNALAHGAGIDVADARRHDPIRFNPLLIHSGVGLGKTHLGQAICARVRANGGTA